MAKAQGGAPALRMLLATYAQDPRYKTEVTGANSGMSWKEARGGKAEEKTEAGVPAQAEPALESGSESLGEMLQVAGKGPSGQSAADKAKAASSMAAAARSAFDRRRQEEEKRAETKVYEGQSPGQRPTSCEDDRASRRARLASHCWASVFISIGSLASSTAGCVV